MNFPVDKIKLELPSGSWTGVRCETVSGAPTFCALCGNAGLKLAHVIKHPRIGEVRVGKVCAGRLTGNPMLEEAREQAFRLRETRRARWANREWKRAKSGVSYASGDGVCLVVYPVKGGFSGLITSMLDDFRIVGRRVFSSEKETQQVAIRVLFNARPEAAKP